MANESPSSGPLPVGESYRQDFNVELEILHRSPAVWEARSPGYGIYAQGVTEEQAMGFCLSAIGSAIVQSDLERMRQENDKLQDGTRQMVGKEVSSESLRDTYLGGKENG